MKKAVFIVNPFSGTSQKGDLSALLSTRLDHQQYTYEIRLTEYAGHATVLAAEAVSQGADLVVAVGGDGSVNEVAQALLHTDTVLGVLPGGSGNGFAMHLGLGRGLGQAIDILNTGVPKVIDTCKVNNRFFINVAGIGFDARIAYMTKLNSKRGFMPYFLTTLREAKSFNPVQLEITVDGQSFNGRYAMAAVANATMFGYYFTICPPARLDDGLLDLVLIKEASILQYAANSYRFLNKSLDRSNITDFYQGRDIRIRLAGEDFYHVDGEGMVSEQDLRFTVVPQSLTVLTPK